MAYASQALCKADNGASWLRCDIRRAPPAVASIVAPAMRWQAHVAAITRTLVTAAMPVAMSTPVRRRMTRMPCTPTRSTTLALMSRRTQRACAHAQVADFLEASTAPWAARAVQLGFAPDCSEHSRAAAAAVLEQECDHVHMLLAAGGAMYPSVPLQHALQTPRRLHAHAIAVRLRSGDLCRRFRGSDAVYVSSADTTPALEGLCGHEDPAVRVDERYHSACSGRGVHIAACHGTPRFSDDLAAPELADAMRALQDVDSCEWLTYNGGHASSDRCSVDHEDYELADVTATGGVGGSDAGSAAAAAAAAVLEADDGSVVAPAASF